MPPRGAVTAHTSLGETDQLGFPVNDQSDAERVDLVVLPAVQRVALEDAEGLGKFAGFDFDQSSTADDLRQILRVGCVLLLECGARLQVRLERARGARLQVGLELEFGALALDVPSVLARAVVRHVQCCLPPRRLAGISIEPSIKLTS